jgi:hypothetical protein
MEQKGTRDVTSPGKEASFVKELVSVHDGLLRAVDERIRERPGFGREVHA